MFLSLGDQGVLGKNDKYKVTEQNDLIGPDNRFVK